MQHKAIGVSKLSPNYEKWLRKLDAEAEIIDLYCMAPGEARNKVPALSGLLLTGGSDIHPSLYGREGDLPYCRDIDEKRDALEMAVIEAAFQYKIPVLGICRGQQILNVARDGDLFADIPAALKSDIQHAGKEDVYHTVDIHQDSELFRITGSHQAVVNSSHHQAINRLGSGFRAVAYSPDALVEAIETDPAVDHPFCMAVQWHPERMDFDNPLSGKLGQGFMEAAANR